MKKEKFEMKKSLYTVYSQRLAGYLMMNGFPLIELVKSQNTMKNHFIFPNTPLLKEYIDKWQIERLNDKTE